MPTAQVRDREVVFVPVIYPGETEPREVADLVALLNVEDDPT